MTVWQVGLLSNIRLFLIVMVSFALQLTIHHVEPLQTLFGTGAVSLNQCIAWTVLGFIPLLVLECRKILRRAGATDPDGFAM
jgi:Ca2+-transporting ATPase